MHYAVIVMSEGGYWARGKSVHAAIKHLSDYQTLRMSTKLNLVHCMEDTDEPYEEWEKSLMCSGMNISRPENALLHQEGEAFALADLLKDGMIVNHAVELADDSDFSNTATQKAARKLDEAMRDLQDEGKMDSYGW